MDKIKFYVSKPIISIDAEAIVTEAALLMRDNNIGSLLVTKDEKYVGIVTEGDLSRKVMARKLNPREIEVAYTMSEPIISIEGNLYMEKAFVSMVANNIRHIVVTESGKIFGILSIKDFANYYKSKFMKHKNGTG